MGKVSFLGKTSEVEKLRLKSMSKDELYSERRVLSQKANVLADEYNTLKRGLVSIKDELARRKHGDGVVVSDHAVLRYIERHMGIDTSAVRASISEMAKARVVKKKSQIVKSGTTNLAMKEDRVCTLWDDASFSPAPSDARRGE